MNKKLILAVVLFVVAAAAPARAWNNTAHAAIAYIAEQHLTPEAKEKCQHYLHHTLPYYASWMDLWRNCEGISVSHYWHGVPVDETNHAIRTNKDNAALQIMRIQRQMKRYDKLSDSIVCDNLKYLIHMVGDMHCPLHTRYVNEPETFPKVHTIYYKGKKWRSHTFWDQSISVFHHGKTLEELSELLDKATPEEIEAICAGTAEDWAYQNAVAMRETYKLLPVNSEFKERPKAERLRMKQIAEEQMLKGAYRLAAILNEIFSK